MSRRMLSGTMFRFAVPTSVLLSGFGAARFFYYLRREMIGDLIIMGKIHGERAPAAQ